jgi:hypothetical protein
MNSSLRKSAGMSVANLPHPEKSANIPNGAKYWYHSDDEHRELWRCGADWRLLRRRLLIVRRA